ncbi:MAG: protein kinase [Deltaproteobacteria bacterium]|nr:protein kinase [Deltaproteobacteria bacterium]
MLAKGELFAGRYEIVDHLGAGGMGVVCRAVDKKLRREVAIKTLAFDATSSRRSSAKREWQKRFEHEALSLAQLDHPNIIAVHDFGEDDGLAYLVMAHFPGQHLDDWWDEQKVTVKQGIGVAKLILRGLEHAHTREVWHRDLKCANILVRGSADAPELKIIDWGLALGGDHSRLTDAGMIVGTRGFQDPEIINDPTLDHDPRSDLYAVGAVLYWLWCQRDHVEVKEEWTDTRKYDAYGKNEVTPPHVHNAEINGDLEKFLLALLAPKRSLRPVNVAAALEWFDLIDRGVPVDPIAVQRRHERATKDAKPGGLLAEIGALVADVREAREKQEAAPVNAEAPMPPAPVEKAPDAAAPEIVRIPAELAALKTEQQAKPAAPVVPDERYDMTKDPPRSARRYVAWVATFAVIAAATVTLAFATKRPEPKAVVNELPPQVTAADLESSRPAAKSAIDQLAQPDTTQRLDAYDQEIVAKYGAATPIGAPLSPSRTPKKKSEMAVSPPPPPPNTSSGFRPASVDAGAAEEKKPGEPSIAHNAETDARLMETLDTSADSSVRAELRLAVMDGDEVVLPKGTLLIGRSSLRNSRASVRFERAVLRNGSSINVNAIAIGSDRLEGIVGRFEYGDKPSSSNGAAAAEIVGSAAADVASALLPAGDALSQGTKRAVNRELDNGRHRVAEQPRRPDRITVARGTTVRVVFNPTRY